MFMFGNATEFLFLVMMPELNAHTLRHKHSAELNWSVTARLLKHAVVLK